MMEGFDILSYLKMFGLNILGSLLLIFIGFKIAKFLKVNIIKHISKKDIDKTLLNYAADVIYFIVLVVILLAALSNIGVNVTSFIAILGAVGLAVGLALKDSLGNIGSSVLILLFRPFNVGDFINAGGEMGSVSEINLFSTTLTTPDNKKIIVPNSSITSGSITNFSANETRRVDFVFGVSYEDDLKTVKNVLTQIVQEHPKVLKEPTFLVALGALADSSVNFNVRVWVKSGDYWDVFYEINEQVKLEFDKNSITIPYPQRELRVHNVN